jgi:hypothetical protein
MFFKKSITGTKPPSALWSDLRVWEIKTSTSNAHRPRLFKSVQYILYIFLYVCGHARRPALLKIKNF